jgi:divalent metal cation (Fe/Co/Zn/Cd) transporter
MKAINFDWYKIPEGAAPNWLLLKVLGVLITAMAVSQGASFWYDMIRRLKGEQISPEENEMVGSVTVTDQGTNVLINRR